MKRFLGILSVLNICFCVLLTTINPQTIVKKMQANKKKHIFKLGEHSNKYLDVAEEDADKNVGNYHQIIKELKKG